MIRENDNIKIDFSRVSLRDKELYERLLSEEEERGCEFSFTNLYLWGKQSLFFFEGQALLLAEFGEKKLYLYPVGYGDRGDAVSKIISDARARKIPCVIIGLTERCKAEIEGSHPGCFEFTTNEGSYDYVYDIDDLAELQGRKYQSKRNHINRFKDHASNYRAEEISSKNLGAIKEMLDEWYTRRLIENPKADYEMERAALYKAIEDYEGLGLVGVAVFDGVRVLAFSMASRISDDTFDVHFEKAVTDVQGAYAVINQELAKFIKKRYPTVKYLDREEDMGIEGLRKAKESYRPHHKIKKYKARLL